MLVESLVKPGDRVKRGDDIAVVETQKGAIEIEIFEAGEIEKFLVDISAKVRASRRANRQTSNGGADQGWHRSEAGTRETRDCRACRQASCAASYCASRASRLAGSDVLRANLSGRAARVTRSRGQISR